VHRSGSESCSCFRRIQVGGIDIRLQDADDSNVEGLELLEEIDKAGLDLKVIIMTGYGTAQTEKRARKSPRCVGFIKKEEFDIRQFVAAVETSVGAPD
jgi:DNA-binding NtrC family response regulator